MKSAYMVLVCGFGLLGYGIYLILHKVTIFIPIILFVVALIDIYAFIAQIKFRRRIK